MLRILTAAALAVGLAGVAFAQTGSGSGSAGGTTGGGGTGASSRSGTLPGTMPGGRSDVAPGSGGPTSGGAILPPGQSPAQQTRTGRGTSDLNNNSATTGANRMTAPGSSSSGAPGTGPTTGRSVTPPIGPGTGARDLGVPDSGVYNPGVSRQQ